jgi:hypothetical protein
MVEKLTGGDVAAAVAAAGMKVSITVVPTVSVSVSVEIALAVEVIVNTHDVGVGTSVSTIVESSVVTSIFVVGGNLEADSVTVVVAGPSDEPPSTATTE